MFESTYKKFLGGIVALSFSAAIADSVSDRITVTVRGQGPDVVLIPGLASSSAVWKATATRFEGRCRLHIVQVAGFAGSLPRANAQGPVLQPTVDAIDAYITTNKLKKPKVIGHSLGGLMGIMLAVQHPEDVGGLMIVDSLPFFGVLFGAQDACLFDSLALMRFLSYYVIFPTCVIGVQTGPFGAHCWVQHDAVVFNDAPEYVRRYTPILTV